MFIPGNTMVENVRALAWSARPDAPVEPEDAGPPGLLPRLYQRLRARQRRTAATPTIPQGNVPATADAC